VRRSLVRQAAKAEKEQEQLKKQTEDNNKDEDSMTAPCEDDGSSVHTETSSSDGTPGSRPESAAESEVAAAPEASTEGETAQKKVGRKKRLKSRLASMKEKRRIKRQESREKKPSLKPVPPRPAFFAATYHKASKVPLEPREVVVPYTRVRTERFYDWPPDPTMSRASPVFLAGSGFAEESFIPSPSEAASASLSLTRRRLSSSKL